MIFVMVSTKRSVAYTEQALQSLYRNTRFDEDDEVVLVVNEPGALPDLRAIGIEGRAPTLIEHAEPKGFAENMNIGFALALERRCGLFCLTTISSSHRLGLDPLFRTTTQSSFPSAISSTNTHATVWSLPTS